ncbi:MAG TPA: TetR/AcrR family transcriptional regulator [Acidimicrobiales bacterium]|nr:TetR/AcrR family transcriptional regulator [Acidimicrobiales bacterium]
MTQPRRRQERAERTRAQIIDTAAAAFAEHGFDGVSFNGLVTESGLSKGAFYFHFSSKEDLAVATFRAKQEEMISRLFSESPPANWTERVAFLLRRRAQLIREDPALLCVSRLGTDLTARSSPGSVYASYHDLALGVIADLVAEGQRAGEFRADIRPEAAARAVFAAMVGMDALSLLSSGGKDLESRTDELIDLLLHGVLPRSGHPKPTTKPKKEPPRRQK